MVNIKPQTILIVLLSITFSVLFFYFRDVATIVNNSTAVALGGEGVSDLSRYKKYYYEFDTIQDILNLGLFNNSIYHLIAFSFKKIGISFELFVFCLIISYYFVFARLCSIFIEINKIYILFFVFCILSFWLIPLTTVAVRQGLTILLIALFWPFEKKSFLVEIFIILVVANIHSTALSLIPLVIFRRIFERRLFTLDFFLIVALILYVSNLFSSFSAQIMTILETFQINTRSFNNSDSSYKIGFSLYKAIAFTIPVVLFRLPRYFNYRRFDNLNGIYVFYVFYGMLAMSLSGLPYHDRVFLYAWTFSPILLITFLIYILPFQKKPS